MFTDIITVTQLNALPNALVFDCRHDLMNPTWGKAQYDAAHLAQAHFASLDDDLSTAKTGHNGRHPLPERDQFVRWLADHGVTQNIQIVCYDQQDGMYAARLWWMCRWAGFSNVAVLEGGYAAWLAAGGLVTSSISIKTPVPAQTLPVLEHVIDAPEVLSNLQTPQFVLIDARAPERYRGEVEPLDPVAGHIPNAVNHVFKRNIDAQGKFVRDLTQQWQSIRAVANGLPLAHQCGSGVTACHNILALHVAGLLNATEASQLYAGSWSEWCSDPTRPVASIMRG